MKLKIYSLITISSLLFLSFSNSNEPKNDLEKQNLNGSVKSITENSYHTVEKFGEILKGEKLDEALNNGYRFTTFNEKGYMTESIPFISRVKFKYNEHNQMIEEDHYESDMKFFYNYNEKGFIVEFNNYHGKELAQKIKFICDEEGNEIEKNSYNSDGSLDYKVKNTFKDGKLIESKKYDSNSVLEDSIKRKYDNNGNEIEIVYYNSSGKIMHKLNYKYDENNQIIENIVYNQNEEATYKYKYLKLDSNKNWTQQIEFKNNNPNKIIERKIEYY